MNDQPDPDMFDDGEAEPATTIPKPPSASAGSTKPAQIAAQPQSGRWDDFFGADSDCLVVHAQDALAVYRNTLGAVVIRRERGWDEDEDEDVIITIRPEHLAALIAALKRYLPE